MKLNMHQVTLFVSCLCLSLAFSANAFNTSQDGEGDAHFAEGEAFDDLIGEDSNAASEGLLTRGYQKVKGSESADGADVLWYNMMNEDCVKVTTVDGVAENMVALESNEACKK